MKPISPLPVQWSSRAGGGARTGWVVLTTMLLMAASSPLLVGAAEMPISAVQEALKREQFFFGEPSGVLDEPTHAALRRFQIRHGLPVSGEIDKATLQALQSPREKDADGAPAPAPGTAPQSKTGSASATTIAKDREFLQDLQQSSPAPGKAPAVSREALPSAPAAAAPVPQATGESTARIVGRRTMGEDEATTPPRTGAPGSVPNRRVVTRTTTTVVTDGTSETDDDPDPIGPHGARIIRPPAPGTVPVPTVAHEGARIVEERTTTVSPATPSPARAPASTSGLPFYPQADEPPSRVVPEAPPRKPQGFFQRLFRGDR